MIPNWTGRETKDLIELLESHGYVIDVIIARPVALTSDKDKEVISFKIEAWANRAENKPKAKAERQSSLRNPEAQS